MRRISTLFLAVSAAALLFSGCGRTIEGPRFWWDDRNQERLPEDYALPPDPGSEMDEKAAKPATASGGDLSDDNLRDYRTDMDKQEENRKKDSSLVDF